MTIFHLRIFAFDIAYDRDYGIDRRCGWSVSWDGCGCKQFAPDPFGAIWRSLTRIRAIVDFNRGSE